MQEFDVKLGFEANEWGFSPLVVNLTKTSHWLIVGGSGSGKSVFLMYVLNQVLNMPIKLFMGDFKGSGDFSHVTPQYAEFEAVLELVEEFYNEYQRVKVNKTGERLLLVIDEYAGFLVWLENLDKKRATAIKGKVAEILMQGRALAGGGSAWFWAVCQRPDMTYFSHGARQNFMLAVGFSRLDKETRTMLGIDSEEVPEAYEPSTGRGLLMIDGRPLSVLQVPELDKEQLCKLHKLLEVKAQRRSSSSEAAAGSPLT